VTLVAQSNKSSGHVRAEGQRKVNGHVVQSGSQAVFRERVAADNVDVWGFNSNNG